jgi:competence protein ComEC
MCFAFCGAFIFRRKSNPFNSLALAAIVLLLIRPTELYEPGWQLSFESVLGILLFAKPFYNFLRDKGLELFGEPDKGGILFRIAAKIASVLWSAFTVSLAAWLSIAGIMLYHFHTIQLLTSVWTVLVSPLIGLVSILGYLKLFITLLSPSIGAALGAIVNFLADILIYIVKLIARLDISEILIGKTFAVAIILYYAVLAYAFFFHQKFQFKKAVCASAAVSLVALVVLPGWQSAYREGLTVTVLDVGHGQAVLAELPDNTNMLFDAGSLSRDDIGTRVVLPFLRYKGIDKIDAVIIGHGDIDHINGLPEINESCRVERFYSNKAFFEEGKDKLTIKFLRGLIEVNDINEMQTACGPAIIKILWPDYETCQNNQISDNDKSAVTMLEYKDRSILICSDIEKPAQKEILRLYPDLRADVVIAPHHGSRKTTDWSFLEQLRPEVVISSCATSAQEKGQVIKGNFYTGTDGAVTVRIDKKGVLTVQKFIKEKPRR